MQVKLVLQQVQLKLKFPPLIELMLLILVFPLFSALLPVSKDSFHLMELTLEPMQTMNYLMKTMPGIEKRLIQTTVSIHYCWEKMFSSCGCHLGKDTKRALEIGNTTA